VGNLGQYCTISKLLIKPKTEEAANLFDVAVGEEVDALTISMSGEIHLLKI